ncbi:hypothetical protein MPSEU_000224400 [Mayamaea pseudoterrestris]|nr:hypothetical protein MPSEU_000224400 [Mayamaea pseudoterrestris]
MRLFAAQTPLHVAASHGCDARIVKMLLTGVSGVMPALVKDKAGNTALHAACSVNFAAFRKQQNLKKLAGMNNATEIVAKLLQANSEAAHLRNKQGETPLELAKKHRADARIISRIEVVQQACRGGEKVCSETFQAPLSSNEFSIVSRPADALEASFSSVGFDNDYDESSSSLIVPAKCTFSAVEEGDEEFAAGVSLLSI